MSTHADDAYSPPTAEPTAEQSGSVVLAAIMLIVGGVYHGLSGVAALFRDQVYVTTPRYTFEFDLTGWGWTHLVLGLVLVVVGFAVVQGRAWARVAGIVLAALSLVANFGFLPHFPVWSIVIIFLDVAVIYALATSGRER
jgi:hypothetical protein